MRGTLTDPSGRALVGVQVKITNEGTGEVRTTSTQGDGAYLFPLLPPGTYRLETSKSGFKAALRPGIHVQVTETAALNFGLELGDVHETVTVVAQAEMLETTSAALGSVVSEKNVAELPLATRNYTQIIALSPGVASEVTSTTAPGRGQSGESGSGEGMEAHGASDSDNNFEMDGVGINDIQGSGDFSGGVAIPNPDTIAEFKVQTGREPKQTLQPRFTVPCVLHICTRTK